MNQNCESSVAAWLAAPTWLSVFPVWRGCRNDLQLLEFELHFVHEYKCFNSKLMLAYESVHINVYLACSGACTHVASATRTLD